MKRIAVVTALLVPVLVLAGCSGSSSSVTDVSAKEAVSISAEEGITVIDVRTPQEFASGHVAGSVNIDVNSPGFEAQIKELPTDGRYLVICRSGNRSGVATDQMSEWGFTSLYDVQGGVQDWANQGGQLVTT